MVCSNVSGRPLDEPDFDQVFGTAASLDLPLLLHPTVPLSMPTLGDYGLTCSVGFLFDTTTAILRLLLGGLFSRYPGLKIVVGHAGSLLPQLAGRLDLQARGRAMFPGAPRTVLCPRTTSAPVHRQRGGLDERVALGDRPVGVPST